MHETGVFALCLSLSLSLSLSACLYLGLGQAQIAGKVNNDAEGNTIISSQVGHDSWLLLLLVVGAGEQRGRSNERAHL